jgi:hypothetical protein
VFDCVVLLKAKSDGVRHAMIVRSEQREAMSSVMGVLGFILGKTTYAGERVGTLGTSRKHHNVKIVLRVRTE